MRRQADRTPKRCGAELVSGRAAHFRDVRQEVGVLPLTHELAGDEVGLQQDFCFFVENRPGPSVEQSR